ncbi:unnamed protein product [Acanthoscelides obtectus]|uniref:Uncharacterized protein n=1 Tax=Acanthoscelides obtectus TaxID=200917 RepID=A0A9P0ME62_ACAOB|nr:unnamed protein product [Acanthoscelides obtectus]CAK1627117.1 hypothetical protein AOBTE_LOCUS4318 [Acanthoscelides obtectus]
MATVLPVVSEKSKHINELVTNQKITFKEAAHSLSQLCISLPSVFHYCRPSDSDFKLYDSSKPLPPSAEAKFTVASYTVESKNLNEGEICALPNIEVRSISPLSWKKRNKTKLVTL